MPQKIFSWHDFSMNGGYYQGFKWVNYTRVLDISGLQYRKK